MYGVHIMHPTETRAASVVEKSEDGKVRVLASGRPLQSKIQVWNRYSLHCQCAVLSSRIPAALCT